MSDWPDWWEWELEITAHLEKRMLDRDFNEIDLRAMLERAAGYRSDIVQGRWIIDARHRRRKWEIIVEPDEPVKLLIVVTAYPVHKGSK